MIHEVTGDILLTKAQAIAHGVAPHDHFDQGLALSLREQWPAMVKDFRHYCHNENPKPGGAWIWSGPGGHRIVSLLTQEPSEAPGGRPGGASTDCVNHCLRSLRRLAESEGLTSIALPRLATGVGGLEWDQVRPLVAHHLGDLKIPVYVYTRFASGVQANEAGL
jgi:O-acetyl-ADP-ribose deacetylase (regulator of RNase III)